MDRAALHLAFDRCPEAVVAASVASQNLLSGPVIYVNPAFSRQTGFAPEDLQGQPAQLCFSGDTASANLRNGGIGPEEQVSLKLRLLHKDGAATAVWTLAWLIPDTTLIGDCVVFQSQIAAPSFEVADSQTEPLSGITKKLTGKLNEVTEPHERTTVLNVMAPSPHLDAAGDNTKSLPPTRNPTVAAGFNDSDRLKLADSVFEYIPDAMLITAVDGTILDWNPAAARMFGYSKDEAVGRAFRTLRGVDPNFHSMQAQAQKEGRCASELVFRNRRKSEVIGRANVLAVNGERQNAFLWMIHDITGERKTRQALQEARNRFSAFAQYTGAAFWMASSDGGRFLYVSPVVEAITGEHFGLANTIEHWMQLIHPEDCPAFEANRKLYIQGQAVRHSYRIIRRDGTMRWIRSDVFPVRNNGEVYCIAGLLEDITDQRDAQEKLQKALEDKEALLREIHHRVKNNLQIISSLLRLQASIADPSSIGPLRESRNRVDTIALLHEHLYQSENVSQIEFRGYAKKLIGNLVGMHAVQQETARVNVDVASIAFGTQTAVLCGLILNELVSNSLRHAFTAGRTGQIDICMKESGERLMICVSDNGIGMPEGFDIDHSHRLGLKLVRQLARQLKGTLSVSKGDGTTVKIEFPREQTR